jgi:hypothetical protein
MKEISSRIVLGMPFFKGIPKVNIPKFLSELKEKWKMNVSEVDGDSEALSRYSGSKWAMSSGLKWARDSG